MCIKCDNDGMTRDDVLNLTLAVIEQYGWSIQAVGDQRRADCYTIGLTPLGLPELVVTCVDPREGATILNAVATVLTTEGTDTAAFYDRAEPLRVTHDDGTVQTFITEVHSPAELFTAKALYEPVHPVRAVRLGTVPNKATS
jgi:hypothetical protein